MARNVAIGDFTREFEAALVPFDASLSVSPRENNYEDLTVSKRSNEQVLANFLIRNHGGKTSTAVVVRLLERLEATKLDDELVVAVRDRVTQQLDIPVAAPIYERRRVGNLADERLPYVHQEVRNEVAQYLRVLAKAQPFGTSVILGFVFAGITQNASGFFAGFLILPVMNWVIRGSKEVGK